MLSMYFLNITTSQVSVHGLYCQDVDGRIIVCAHCVCSAVFEDVVKHVLGGSASSLRSTSALSINKVNINLQPHCSHRQPRKPTVTNSLNNLLYKYGMHMN